MYTGRRGRHEIFITQGNVSLTTKKNKDRIHFIGLIASSPVNSMKGDSKLFLHQEHPILAVHQKTSIVCIPEVYTEFVLFHLDYFELK